MAVMTEYTSKVAPTRPLPPGFADYFCADVLSRDPSTVVLLDPHGFVLWTNPAWYRFAEENGGQAVLSGFGIGSSYGAGISGELRAYFEDAFQRCFGEGRVFELDYECPSPTKRRFMRLRALPILGAGIVLSHSLVAESSDLPEAAAAVEARYLNPQGIIVQCSNCRRVRQAQVDQWDWVPDWIRTVDPRVSHGLCELCKGFYFKQRRRPAAAR